MFMADPSFQWPWDQRLQMAYCHSLMFMGDPPSSGTGIRDYKWHIVLVSCSWKVPPSSGPGIRDYKWHIVIVPCS